MKYLIFLFVFITSIICEPSCDMGQPGCILSCNNKGCVTYTQEEYDKIQNNSNNSKDRIIIFVTGLAGLLCAMVISLATIIWCPQCTIYAKHIEEGEEDLENNYKTASNNTFNRNNNQDVSHLPTYEEAMVKNGTMDISNCSSNNNNKDMDLDTENINKKKHVNQNRNNIIVIAIAAYIIFIILYIVIFFFYYNEE